MASRTVQISVSGPDMHALLRAVAALPAYEGIPKTIHVDYEARTTSAGWLDDYAGAASSNLAVDWDEALSLQFVAGQAVFFWLPHKLDPAALHKTFARLPLELGVVAPLYEEWTDADDFEHFGFGDRHATHGFACAFKGDGHERLVSPRWLEHGPWLLHRSGDVTLVQFHDLAAEPMTALAQANPGRLLLSREDETGYLAPAYRYQHDLAGVYAADREVQKVIINDRNVSAAEMRDACALRRDKRDDPDKPIARVAFVFMQEELARKYLRDLWLRELECWALIAGREIRLDIDYVPSPATPEWANA